MLFEVPIGGGLNEGNEEVLTLAWPFAVGLIVSAVCLTAFIWWIIGLWLRLLAYSLACFAGRQTFRNVGRFFFKYFHAVSFIQAALIIAVVVISTYWLRGDTGLLEGFVIALAAIGFLFIEGPRLAPPSIQAAFLPAIDNTSWDDSPTRQLSAGANRPWLLFIRITNLSLYSLESCTVRFSFNQGFEILDDETLYRSVEDKKSVAVRRRTYCAVFEPGLNHMSVAPANHLVFPVWVRTPPAEGDYDVRVSCSSLSRSGEAEVTLTLQIA